MQHLLLLPFIFLVSGSSFADTDIKSPDWCGTQHLSNQKRQAVGCGWGVRCEDPLVRDTYQPSFKSEVFNVSLKFMIFGHDTVSQDLINAVAALMDTTSKMYSLAKISFVWKIGVAPTTEFNGIHPSLAAQVTKMKTTYAESPELQMNIFVPQFLQDALLGWAIFPINPDEALSASGGIVMTFSELGSGKYTLAHEMGHAFGLLHTHESSPADQGIAMVPCDICGEYARQPSDIKGDLISDTPPTLENYKCSNPTAADCQGTPYGPTDYYNLMGYASNACFDQGGHFSLQQMGRMRCFIERVLPGWLSNSRMCTTVNDCADNNLCTFETCVNGACQTRLTKCGNSSTPCTDLVCDPLDGQCKPITKNCTSPPSLPCAVASCDASTNLCLTNYSVCAPPDSFSNDCCQTSTTPFCNNTQIVDCVCSYYNQKCCTDAWDHLCTLAVAACSDTRDCLAENLPDPTNTNCEVAQKVVDGMSVIFKSSPTDLDNFNCLGVPVSSHGAWWYVTGGDFSSVSLDTCFMETAVIPTIYVFSQDCISGGGECTSKAISSSSCTAQLTLEVGPDQVFIFFVGSEQFGTIRVDFSGTGGSSSGSFPVGAIIALVILSTLAVLVIALIVYLLLNPTRTTDMP